MFEIVEREFKSVFEHCYNGDWGQGLCDTMILVNLSLSIIWKFRRTHPNNMEVRRELAEISHPEECGERGEDGESKRTKFCL